MTQLASAVAALHKADVLHRDIKSSNVVVTTDERLVLLDFGLAADVSQAEGWLSANTNIVGTVAYMSPERAGDTAVTHSSDWYSVGVVLYQVLTGDVPFRGSPLAMLTDKQSKEPPPPCALVEGVPDDLNQLCIELLKKDPNRRPAADRILGALGDGIALRGRAIGEFTIVPAAEAVALRSPGSRSAPWVSQTT